MFGLDKVKVTPINEIPLSTRKGTRIENYQGSEVPIGSVWQFYDGCSKNNWKIRRSSFGLYNCAGMVWASRRTGITGDAIWNLILHEDGYRQIEHPLLDDIVIYRNQSDQKYYHVAKIIQLRDGISADSPKVPFVLSKWGYNSGECIHNAYEHELGSEIKIEFWTERPENEQLPSKPSGIII